MDRVIRGGCVAVLVSPGFGAGWYSWHGREELLFDPVIVDLVEQDQRQDIDTYVKITYGQDVYTGGALDLIVEWVPIGSDFRIQEHDGDERLILASQQRWIRA